MQHNHMVNINTFNGSSGTKDKVILKLRIFDIEKEMAVFIIGNKEFSYDFLAGLDCCKEFNISHNKNLEIIQNNKINKIIETTKTENVKIPDIVGDIIVKI